MSDWLTKNKDPLNDTVVDQMKKCDNALVVYLFRDHPGQPEEEVKKGEKGKKGKDTGAGKSEAMQRVAVTLRQKAEFSRAEKLMLRAIQAKKAILKTEASEDIAYLYNELAITY